MTWPKLAWVPGLKGPAPQIWHGPQFRDQKPVKNLQEHELNEEQAQMNLDQLAKLFPLKTNEAGEPCDGQQNLTAATTSQSPKQSHSSKTPPYVEP